MNAEACSHSFLHTPEPDGADHASGWVTALTLLGLEGCARLDAGSRIPDARADGGVGGLGTGGVPGRPWLAARAPHSVADCGKTD